MESSAASGGCVRSSGRKPRYGRGNRPLDSASGVARDNALASDTLRKYVAGPLDKLLGLVKVLPGGFKNGTLGPADIAIAAAGFCVLKLGAGTAGVDIQDRSAPIPGF